VVFDGTAQQLDEAALHRIYRFDKPVAPVHERPPLAA
jgi:hypothetical protein